MRLTASPNVPEGVPSQPAAAPSAGAGGTDPNGDWTCDSIGVSNIQVPAGSKHDADGDGVACEK